MFRHQKQQKRKIRSKCMFTKEEDRILTQMVNEYGEHDWNFIASFLDGRNKRQCRERWKKFVSPLVNVGPWSLEEDQLLLEKYEEIGPRWTLIAKSFNNRSDINIKSRFSVVSRRNDNWKFTESEDKFEIEEIDNWFDVDDEYVIDKVLEPIKKLEKQMMEDVWNKFDGTSCFSNICEFHNYI
ncbi:Myb-like DNA-binding domain containing protein [Tritrichomonas foetus]|uniref:Myb-like DNA-binding domain containing protein n=1 Tax=Tritrichomonas foetus TaxID=1144522 RepID=A0A1J4JS52_9EUKA|nr:Myb-like DNA-binding domain containing protein [Tritrichomonas foetus]|eukprot:OHT01875.1 Myb-like DNA-binding domain containing protein [Tritrichomonas foetus]